MPLKEDIMTEPDLYPVPAAWASQAHMDAAALEAARTVTEGLVRCIAEEVAHQRAQTATYGESGAAGPGAGATAITLNKRA